MGLDTYCLIAFVCLGLGMGLLGGDGWLSSYQGGRGSLWFRLAISEPSERVSCTRRCRDCSRTLICSWVRLDMAG